MIDFRGHLDEAIETYIEKGWTDGLPVIPPTEERVAGMLRFGGRDADDVVAEIPPAGGRATVGLIAVNAVMAGCRPEYLPLCIAAVDAIADPALGLHSIQSTTNPAAVLLVVNGPLATEARLNGGGNCLGPGNRANATIGRMLRLVMLNIGGGSAGDVDKSTQGQPGKYTMCIAENQAESPWEPWHVEQGFDAAVSVVTAVSVTGTQHVLDAASKTAEGILGTIAHSCAYPGCQNFTVGGGPLLILGPEHAALIAQAGYDKRSVKQYLFDAARVPLTHFSPENLQYRVSGRPPEIWAAAATHGVALADSVDQINVVVAGGAGSHSTFCPSFGRTSRHVARLITDGAGQPLTAIRARS